MLETVISQLKKQKLPISLVMILVSVYQVYKPDPKKFIIKRKDGKICSFYDAGRLLKDADILVAVFDDNFKTANHINIWLSESTSDVPDYVAFID